MIKVEQGSRLRQGCRTQPAFVYVSFLMVVKSGLCASCAAQLQAAAVWMMGVDGM